MKQILLVLLFSFAILIFQSCEKSSPNLVEELSFQGSWQLVGLSTSSFTFRGCDFETQLVHYNFSASTLTVTSSGESRPQCTVLAPGQYSYRVFESDGNTFLEIDNSEFGEIRFSPGELFINQDNRSTGPYADGFYLNLVK